MSKQFNTTLENNRLLTAFIIVSTLFFLILAVFTPAYETNDDTAMALSVAGKVITDEPNPYIRNSNILIGFILTGLHSLSQNIPWYACYLVLSHFLAQVFLLYSLILYKNEKDGTTVTVMLYTLYFILVEIHFLLNLQFTTTACVCALAGLFLFYTAVERQYDTNKNNTLMYAGACGILFLSSLIRFEALLLMTALFLPLPFYRLLKNFNKKTLLKYVFFFAITGVLSVGANSYNSYYLKKDGKWDEYFEKLPLLQRIIDFGQTPYNENTKEKFDKVGWSYVDFAMLMGWNFSDKELFSTDKMKLLLAEFPPDKRLKTPVTTIFTTLQAIFKDNMVHFILFTLVLFAFVSNYEKDKIVIFLITVGLLFTILSYMILFMKVERRVYLSMFSALSLLALFFADFKLFLKDKTSRKEKKKSPQEKTPFNMQTLLACTVLVGAIFMSINVFSANLKQSALNRHWSKEIKASIEKLKPNKSQLYVVWGPAFPFEKLLPFEGLDYLKNFNVLWLCGLTTTPFFDNRMEAFQIKNINTAIYEKNNIFLFIPPQWIKFYSAFIKNHYGVELKFAKFKGSKFFYLYKVLKKRHNY